MSLCAAEEGMRKTGRTFWAAQSIHPLALVSMLIRTRPSTESGFASWRVSKETQGERPQSQTGAWREPCGVDWIDSRPVQVSQIAAAWVLNLRRYFRAQTKDGTHWELGENVRSSSHTHSDHSTEAGRETEWVLISVDFYLKANGCLCRIYTIMSLVWTKCGTAWRGAF